MTHDFQPLVLRVCTYSMEYNFVQNLYFAIFDCFTFMVKLRFFKEKFLHFLPLPT